MPWDLFISYASEDRVSFADPLARALQAKGLQVWFDEFELRPGDSIRDSIDRGLSQSKLGVIVLSASFFQKSWTRLELGGLLAQHAAQGRRIVPVWHDVDLCAVLEHAPMLADIKAVMSSAGVEQVASEIASVFAATSNRFQADLRLEAILVDVRGQVQGIDETFVEYNTKLVQDGRDPDLSIEINREPLSRVVRLQKVLYDAIEGSCDIRRLLADFDRLGAKGKEQRALYLALREAATELNELEREIRAGLLQILTRATVIAWLASNSGDQAQGMRGYVARFFLPPNPLYGITLWWKKAPGDWKARVFLTESEAVQFRQRTGGSCFGASCMDFTHRMIVGSVVPSIIFRVIRRGVPLDSISEELFDVEQWGWELYVDDPGWSRLTPASTGRPASPAAR